jgi:PDZ domain-containing protein
MKRLLRVSAIAILLTAIVAAAWVRLPYYAVGPGPAREVTPLIRFDGPQRYESAGTFVMTTVRWYQVTPLQAVVAWLDPDVAVLPERDLYPPGLSREQEQQRSVSQMDQSKIDASYVVLSRLTGYPREHGDGSLIDSTIEGCPAFGQLFPGDLVTEIDGDRIDSARDASNAIQAAPPGEPLAFQIQAAGEKHEVDLTRERCVEGDKHAYVGVGMVDAFPFPLTIESGDVGGPSAGLMWALGLYDLLTPDDITGGLVIAGTGTIDRRGRVGPIGGIEDKIVAARDAGAAMFLVPTKNMAQAEGVDAGDMRLVSVATFDDALQALGVSPGGGAVGNTA